MYLFTKDPEKPPWPKLATIDELTEALKIRSQIFALQQQQDTLAVEIETVKENCPHTVLYRPPGVLPPDRQTCYACGSTVFFRVEV